MRMATCTIVEWIYIYQWIFALKNGVLNGLQVVIVSILTMPMLLLHTAILHLVVSIPEDLS